jgi:hypothetical protein
MATTSIVDYLNSIGQASDFNTRSKLAQQYGITNYTGTAEQNLSLLAKLQGNQTSTTTPTDLSKLTLTGLDTSSQNSASTSAVAPGVVKTTTPTSQNNTGIVVGGTTNQTNQTSQVSQNNQTTQNNQTIQQPQSQLNQITQYNQGNSVNIDPSLYANLIKLGLSPEQIAWMSSNDAQMFSSLSDYIAKQNESGTTGAFDINEALKAAQADPDIAAKYGDSLKMGMSDFQYALQNQQSEASQWTREQAAQMKEDRQKLQESEADAGRAYSGFRQQANEKMTNANTGIIESTKRTLENNLRTLGSNFEKQYGSSATPQANTSFINPMTGQSEQLAYNPVGGITGTNPLAQKGDILTKQASLLSLNPTT